MLNSSLSATRSHSLPSTPTLSPLSSTSFPSLSTPSPSSVSCLLPSSSSSSSSSFSKKLTYLSVSQFSRPINPRKQRSLKVKCCQREPLKVMISGAPASGKGTQCEMISQKFGLVHVSTGDLLRAEVSAGTDIGNKAKEYMNSGRLVPDEIVTSMVTARLSLKDAKEKGWLLDGYPRSLAQAKSLEKLKIRPDVYIMLDVPDEILIDRCIGRRLDPVTGRIYHEKNFPPETEEIKARLVTRPDDTEEKVKARLQIYKQNSEAVLPIYSDILRKVNGNRMKEVVFNEIDLLLSQVLNEKEKAAKSGLDFKLILVDQSALLQNEIERKGNDMLPSFACCSWTHYKSFLLIEELSTKTTTSQAKANMVSSSKVNWRGIPTRLNNIPHSREIREYFYDDVLQAIQRAVNNGKTRLKVEINIPELNPEMDVYRIGTLMELVRVLALSFADDGKRIKVCVQGSMGEGALAGMPLQLAGSRTILEFMDWGDDGALGTFVKIGSIGAKEVEEQDDMFILVAPQNAVGNCIIGDLKAMTDAAGSRPVILVNPRLKDVPGSSGIMQTMGRQERLEYAASFEICYLFRLLYYAGTQYPIMAALRMSYPYPYELYKRVDETPGKEKYVLLTTFEERPSGDEINNAFEGKPRSQEKKPLGIWGFLSGIL